MVSEMKCSFGKRWYRQCARQTPRQICEWPLRNLQVDDGTFCMAECRHHPCRFQATKTEWQYRLTDRMRGIRRQLNEKCLFPSMARHNQAGSLPFPRQRAALITSWESKHRLTISGACCVVRGPTIPYTTDACLSLICNSCQDSSNLQPFEHLWVIL
jgi:hypothetical protein